MKDGNYAVQRPFVLVTKEDMPLAAAKGVTFRLKGQNCIINAAEPLAHEILCNLLDNAIKYNVESGFVTVIVKQDGAGVSLCVSDTGIGIPAEHQSRVFERFYRADKSRFRDSGGTGLGLSIVKHAMETSGGTIRLESQSGTETAVTVTFPGPASAERFL